VVKVVGSAGLEPAASCV